MYGLIDLLAERKVRDGRSNVGDGMCLGVLVSCLGETRNTWLNLTKFPRNSPFGQKELGTT